MIVDKPVRVPLVGPVVELLRPLTEEIRHIDAVHPVKEVDRSVPWCDENRHAVWGVVNSMLNVWDRDTTIWWPTIVIEAEIVRKTDERAKTSGPRSSTSRGKCENRFWQMCWLGAAKATRPS